MKRYRILLVLCSLLLLTYGDDANKKNQSTSPPATTEKPKEKSPPICGKCSCRNETKTLDCSNRKLDTWLADDEWAQINNTFDIVRLDHNKFKTVEVIPKVNIKRLDLSFNQIVSIDKAAFQNLQQVVSLDLSHNNLTSENLNPDVFQGQYTGGEGYLPIGKLTELNLAYNELHTLDQDVFEHFPALERLILNNNIFKIIDHQTIIAISNIYTMKYLDMGYAELRDIPDTIFHAPKSLEVLDLRGNLFQKIPAALEHAVNLKQLYLDENPFDDLTGKNVFPVLPLLENLTLTELEAVTKIGKGAFSGLIALKELHIEGCLHLSEIHPEAFSRPGKENRSDYPPMEKLILSRNNLSSLDHALLARWDNVKLDISKNSWDCQCQNEWLVHDLYPLLRQDDPVGSRRIKCASPKNLITIPFEQIYEDKNVLRCADAYGNYPENDGTILVGLLVGLLIGVPVAMAILLIYKRGCFGLIKSYRYEQSRALYNRASLNEDY